MWLQIVLDLLSTLFVLFFFWKYQVITFQGKEEAAESGEQDPPLRLFPIKAGRFLKRMESLR